jgi:hypothetical protein
MMTENQPWRFRFHLDTAFLMMLSASGLLLANVSPYDVARLRPLEMTKETDVVLGWPLNGGQYRDGVNLFVCLALICMAGFFYEYCTDVALRRRCRLDVRTKLMISGMSLLLIIANVRAYDFAGIIAPNGYAYGWPFCFFVARPNAEWFMRPLAIDFAAAVIVLVLATIACESLVRLMLQRERTVNANFQPFWILFLAAIFFGIEPTKISPFTRANVTALQRKTHYILCKGIERELNRGEDGSEMMFALLQLGLSRDPECREAEEKIKARILRAERERQKRQQ